MEAYASDDRHQLSESLIYLLKGIIYRDDQAQRWQQILVLQHQIHDYIALLGLGLTVNEAEGYAYLSSLNEDERGDIPRLVRRMPLTYEVSLILSLLRERLMQHDTQNAESRLILSVDSLFQDYSIFFPHTTDEVKASKRMYEQLQKIADLGFIRFIDTNKQDLEVRRIIKDFVNAEWLSTFQQRVQQETAVAKNTSEVISNDDL